MTSRWIVFKIGNISHKICREDQNTRFMSSNFFFCKWWCLWDYVEKYDRVWQATDGNAIPRMRFACQINSTGILTQYLFLCMWSLDGGPLSLWNKKINVKLSHMPCYSYVIHKDNKKSYYINHHLTSGQVINRHYFHSSEFRTFPFLVLSTAVK